MMSSATSPHVRYLPLLLAACIALPAAAGPIGLDTRLVYDGAATDTDVAGARLADDEGQNYVVFQTRPNGPFGAGPGFVTYQPLSADGAPDGASRLIGDQTASAGLPDASGQYVVYPSRDGEILRLYDLETGLDFVVDAGGAGRSIGEARIDGEMLFWGQEFAHPDTGEFLGRIVEAQNVLQVGVTPPAVVRGPVPDPSDPEAGARYLVWEETIDGAPEPEVRAQEIGGSSFFVYPGRFDDGFAEVDPATWGSLIAFGLVDVATGLADIVLRDILADTTQVFSLGLAGLGDLSLAQDFVGFNAFDADGVTQAFLLSLLDGSLTQLSDGPLGAGTTDVFDDLVTWTEGRQVYVAQVGEGAVAVAAPGTFGLLCLGLLGLAWRRR